jgi:hypothetical protein
MRKQIALLLILDLCFQSFTFAAEQVSAEDRMIGSTFKALAKTFILFADLDKLKETHINQINKMSEEKFKEEYSKAYKIIKDFPAELQASYGISETMTKARAIKNINSLDKKKIYNTIDCIPDATIASQFKEYLGREKQGMQKSNLVEQIKMFWERIMEKFNLAPAPAH